MKFFITASALFLMSASAMAAPSQYNCFAAGSDRMNPITFTVTVSKTKIAVKSDDDGEVNEGKIDRSYNPRYNKNFVRFSGDWTAFGQGEEGYEVEVLVSQDMLDGEE